MAEDSVWFAATATLARLSALSLLAAMLGYAGHWHWLLDLCAHFRWQYLLALSVGLIAAIVVRKRALVLALTCGWLLNSWSLATANGPTSASLPRASATATLTVLVVNIHVGLSDAAPLLALIEHESPDIIGILELSPGTAEQLSVLAERYPSHRADPRENPFGIGAWSRLPLSAIEIVPTPPLDHPSLRLQFAEPAAGQLWLTHPFPPIGAQGSTWRDQQMEYIATRIGRDPTVLVAGDFNATPWSAAYRDFRGATGLLDSAAGQWPWPTWFGENIAGRILAVPIDYVFHGAGWRVIERRIGPDIGSDHRPLIVRLARAD